MTKKIDIPHESDESKEVRPTFFNEPPVMYTGGDLPWQWEEDGMVCTRSAAWSAPGCHDGCGVVIYTDKETGKFIKVEGDEENPITRDASARAASTSPRPCTTPTACSTR